VWYNIRYEMRHFVQSRQHLLTDPVHSATAQSRTLLITGIPARYLTERQLFNLFSYLPGGVEQVWLNRDLKDLPDVYNAREDACKKLESAETELLATATKNHFKKIATEEEADRKTNKKTDKTREEHAMQEVKGTRPLTAASVHSNADIERDIALAEKLVPREQRPTHRLLLWAWLPFGIPFTGKKVDSIDWAREEIARCNEVLEQGRLQWRKDVASDDDNADDMYKPLNSAFVLFKQQIAAHLALQSLTHHGPYRMSGKHIEIAERDVIWDNLGLNPYEQRVRRAISLGVTAGLVILWSFPGM
jgi:calcium permeable stress-gated cation channel